MRRLDVRLGLQQNAENMKPYETFAPTEMQDSYNYTTQQKNDMKQGNSILQGEKYVMGFVTHQ